MYCTDGDDVTVPGYLTLSRQTPDSAAVTDNVPVVPAPQPNSSRPTVLFYCFTYRVKNCLKYLSSTMDRIMQSVESVSPCVRMYVWTDLNVIFGVDNTIFMGR